MKRESFRSRLGFLLVSAGCAIGIGNVWRFPYIAGKNGGGYFVLFYLLCLLVMGVPVLTMELAVGRASRRSAVLSYKTLEKSGQKWHIHGWFCLLGCYLLMMYYTTVSGWMVSYFGKFLTGAFHSGMSTDEVASAFGAMLSSPGEMALWAEVVVVAGFLVCSFGLQKGLERVTKVMMLCLLALILVLAVHSLTLSGAAEGMKFYLVPSMDSIRENGFGSLVTDAMNQAFFTLSLGIAAMEIFGSYMSGEHTLPGEAVRICALDTFVALMAGTIIFPACFTFGVTPDNGPSLIFQTLPPVFINMAGGRFWGALFFLFMIFASFSTVLAVFENILAICIFLVTYGRMIEIYVVTSLGPIPLATMGNSEWRGMGQNYLKSLLALGFQAFLIMVVVGIYAVLIQNIASASDVSGAIWGCMGYTVLLCFCLFKTGSISKSVFSAH